MHLGARGGLENEVFLLAVLDLVESKGLEATSGLEETAIVKVRGTEGDLHGDPDLGKAADFRGETDFEEKLISM